MEPVRLTIEAGVILGRDGMGRNILSERAVKHPELIGSLVPATITPAALKFFESIVRALVVTEVIRKRG
jgi:hypothetical protein